VATQFVQHVAAHLIRIVLDDHADGIPLPHVRVELLVGPGELKALLLDPQYVGQVFGVQPADVHGDPLRVAIQGQARDSPRRAVVVRNCDAGCAVVL